MVVEGGGRGRGHLENTRVLRQRRQGSYERTDIDVAWCARQRSSPVWCFAGTWTLNKTGNDESVKSGEPGCGLAGEGRRAKERKRSEEKKNEKRNVFRGQIHLELGQARVYCLQNCRSRSPDSPLSGAGARVISRYTSFCSPLFACVQDGRRIHRLSGGRGQITGGTLTICARVSIVHLFLSLRSLEVIRDAGRNGANSLMVSDFFASPAACTNIDRRRSVSADLRCGHS